MDNKNFLFIVKERQVYGAKTRCYGLFNSCNFVSNTLNEHGIKATTIQVIDNNCIDKHVTKHKPTHCIIEALWVVPEKFVQLSKLHPNVKWIVRLHSHVPFLATEGIAFDWITEYIRLKHTGINIEVAGNNKSLVDELRTVFGHSDIEFLPNIYAPKK